MCTGNVTFHLMSLFSVVILVCAITCCILITSLIASSSLVDAMSFEFYWFTLTWYVTAHIKTLVVPGYNLHRTAIRAEFCHFKLSDLHIVCILCGIHPGVNDVPQYVNLCDTWTKSIFCRRTHVMMTCVVT